MSDKMIRCDVWRGECQVYVDRIDGFAIHPMDLPEDLVHAYDLNRKEFLAIQKKLNELLNAQYDKED